MPKYRWLKIAGGCFFFTVCLADRRATTLVNRIDDLKAAWRWTQERMPFSNPAWVVLPDHIHCIWKLPPDDDNYALRWSLFKRHFTRALGRSEAVPKGNRKEERRVWQRRFVNAICKLRVRTTPNSTNLPQAATHPKTFPNRTTT